MSNNFFGGEGKKVMDQDLLLFRDLQKREKDRIASLLLPASDEFEPHNLASNGGNYALYRIGSGKNKASGFQLFPDHPIDKNDYDWLKTPPATPLFPSLEMEPKAQQPQLQSQLPILQPLSRFAGNSGAAKGSTCRPKSSNTKAAVSSRSTTPRSRVDADFMTEVIQNRKGMHKVNHRITQPSTAVHLNNTKRPNVPNSAAKSSSQQEKCIDFLASNLSKKPDNDSKAKRRSRGVSPSPRSTVTPQLAEFSNETPPNLLTERPASAMRGRPIASQQQPRRQSCSPSVRRGRREECNKANTTQTAASGKQVMGSRMVDKVINARKSSVGHKGAKPKSQYATAFDRITLKTSVETLKHTK